MTKKDVKIGGVYIAKVTNRLVRVRIDAVSRYGGWEATNLITNKKVRIKSAQKLRAAVVAEGAKTGVKNAKLPMESQAGPTSTPTVADTAHVQTTSTEVCPNCGSTQRDEDGDCRQCYEPTPAKPADKPQRAKGPKPRRTSGLDAAARVLQEADGPLNVKQIVEIAAAKGYWRSPGGKTPSATIYSAIVREIAKKGQEARFRKAERGRFVHA